MAHHSLPCEAKLVRESHCYSLYEHALAALARGESAYQVISLRG
jgi:hypothetical protein